MNLLQGSTNYSPETKSSPLPLTPDLEDSRNNINGWKAITPKQRILWETIIRTQC